MVDNGRDDFTTYLSELLGISKQWANVKINGNSDFTYKELKILVVKLKFTLDEIADIFSDSKN